MACIDHDAARIKIVDKKPNVHSRSTGPSGPRKGKLTDFRKVSVELQVLRLLTVQ